MDTPLAEVHGSGAVRGFVVAYSTLGGLKLWLAGSSVRIGVPGGAEQRHPSTPRWPV